MVDAPGPEASEPFERLANGTRLGIVRALGEAMAGGSHSPLAFSELQEMVGVDDNGKFNYHLSQIRGRFVEKIDEGYRLNPAGISVFQAIKSGAYDAGVVVPPTEIDDPCETCDERVSIWYEGGRAYIGCEHCDDVSLRYPLPARTFEEDDATSLAVATSTRISRDYRSFLHGVCPYCSGQAEADIVEETPEGITDELGTERAFFGRFRCTRCYWFVRFSFGGGLREHPAVVSFFYERGLNLFEVRQWNTPFEYEVTPRSTKPLELAVTYEYDDDSRTLVVDDELQVVAVED